MLGGTTCFSHPHLKGSGGRVGVADLTFALRPVNLLFCRFYSNIVLLAVALLLFIFLWFGLWSPAAPALVS